MLGSSLNAARVGLAAHGRYEARELALRMLTGDDPPTAIFAASDTQAFGVMAAAREAGLQVPDDLSIVGYDDIEAADYVGLSTIRQQLFESGRRGAELLLAEIERPSEQVPVGRSCHPSSWCVRPRRQRRRAVAERTRPALIDTDRGADPTPSERHAIEGGEGR